VPGPVNTSTWWLAVSSSPTSTRSLADTPAGALRSGCRVSRCFF
jgi:hypothetical protein